MSEPICANCNDVLDHQDPEYCQSCFDTYEVATNELIIEREALRARVAELEYVLSETPCECDQYRGYDKCPRCRVLNK